MGKHFRAVTAQSLFMVCLAASSLFSQTATNFEQRIQTIVSRPEFAHSTFGIEFYSLDTGKPIYQLNPDKLLVQGSTTKLLTEGTLLELLGTDYRFHTRVYRTGSVKKGTLDGDLVRISTAVPGSATARVIRPGYPVHDVKLSLDGSRLLSITTNSRREMA